MPKTHKPVLIAALLLSLLPVAAYARLASFTRLLGDDFCSYYFAERFGLLRSIWYWRLNWSGRYSAFIADWLVAKFAGPYGLRILLPLLLVLWLLFTALVIHAALQRLAPERNNRLAAAALSLVFLTLVLVASPDVPQSVLWWNGMRSYSLPLVVLTCYVLLFYVLRDRIKTRPALIVSAALSLLLFFLSAGLSETFAVFQFFLLVFLVVLQLAPASQRKLDPTSILLLCGLVGTALGLLVIVSAPGNALRQQQLPPPPGLLEMISISLRGYGYYISRILLSPLQMSAVLGALLLALWAGSHYPEAAAAGTWRIAAWAVAGLLLSFACFPPAVYGYSEIPPPRMIMIPWFGLAGCLMIAAFLSGARLARGQRFSARAPMMVLAAVILIGYASIASAISLLSQVPAYQAFAEHWDRADQQIVQARAAGEASVAVPAEQNWAGINILNDNPRFWVNVCYSQYYGIPVFAEVP